MKYIDANIIISKTLNILVDDEKITSKQADFLKRILDDMFYCKKVDMRTLKHFQKLYPEMFTNDTKEENNK